MSVGGRDVCWWELSAIVAGFEPGGEGGREGWEEEMGGGIGRGDVAVRSTDYRRGDSSSFLPLTRRDTTTWTRSATNSGRRVDSIFFILSGGTTFSQTRVVRST